MKSAGYVNAPTRDSYTTWGISFGSHDSSVGWAADLGQAEHVMAVSHMENGDHNNTCFAGLVPEV